MEKNKRLGLIVNPVAGMGGRLGLKGSDGYSYNELLRLGAEPVSPRRALRFLRTIEDLDVELVVANGLMGYSIVEKTRLINKVVEVINSIGSETSREDTIRVARKMKDKVDLIVFVGGDGTARDIYDAVGTTKPVLGVPSGVKIYSAVFANTPEEAGVIVRDYFNGKTQLEYREVLDIDEEAFRKNKLVVKLYGYLLVPVVIGYIQPSKSPSRLSSEYENMKAIARYIVENMENNTLYILGPGTTVKAITDLLGLEKTLLGVDALYNKRIIARDLSEKEILSLLDKYPHTKIIVTPIGGQGFIFGRGNQQISPRVIKRVGRDNIIVIATWSKIEKLQVLRVDTGEPEVDEMLRGYIRVLVDYNYWVIRKII